MRMTASMEEHVAHALRQAEAGTPVLEVCRKLGDKRADVLPLETELRWDGQIRIAELRQLEDEIRQFKQLMADLTLASTCFRRAGVHPKSGEACPETAPGGLPPGWLWRK